MYTDSPLLFSQAIIASFSVYAFADEKRIHKKPPFNSERLFETFCPFLNVVHPFSGYLAIRFPCKAKATCELVRTCASFPDLPQSDRQTRLQSDAPAHPSMHQRTDLRIIRRKQHAAAAVRIARSEQHTV